MNKLAETSICTLPEFKGPGGPSSFQDKLKKGLAAQGIQTHHDIRRPGTKALLVISGTKRLGDLHYARSRGIRIVQRLDGMNWLHRRRPTGFRHYLKSEFSNLQLSLIRRYVADRIVYQSNFARDWWRSAYGTIKKPSIVALNGVDLDNFHPSGYPALPQDYIRLLVVEANFEGGYESGLINATMLAGHLSKLANKNVELIVIGNVPVWVRKIAVEKPGVSIQWIGFIPRSEISAWHHRSHLMFSADINAACPNSAIEALASGLPVVSFATGSLPEIIGTDGGAVVPYGADYWRLEAPDTKALANAAVKVLDRLPGFRLSARNRAEELFSSKEMVRRYKEVLLGN